MVGDLNNSEESFERLRTTLPAGSRSASDFKMVCSAEVRCLRITDRSDTE